ncbi:CNK [Mytilus edulis]|uniref:PLK3 n=1 Tax=Mytilus edulis TaxID=6550 RepID=A0A8S3VGM9_MYTED|nr:CNK [Mytilus edulis]
MSFAETTKILAESRKVIEDGNENNTATLLTLILSVVTSVEHSIKKIESGMESIEKIKTTVTLLSADLRFCPTKFENCENKLRGFLRHELEIDHFIEFGNVHRFGKTGLNGARHILARLIYHNDLQFVLNNAFKLKGAPFGISEQFPAEIKRRKTICGDERSQTTTKRCSSSQGPAVY